MSVCAWHMKYSVFSYLPVDLYQMIRCRCTKYGTIYFDPLPGVENSFLLQTRHYENSESEPKQYNCGLENQNNDLKVTLKLCG